MRRLNANPAQRSLAGQPTACSGESRPADLDPRALYLRSRLLGISSVGEENAVSFTDYKCASAAGESAQIMNIGKMSNHECIQAALVERQPRTGQPAFVIHEQSLSHECKAFCAGISMSQE